MINFPSLDAFNFSMLRGNRSMIRAPSPSSTLRFAYDWYALSQLTCRIGIIVSTICESFLPTNANFSHSRTISMAIGLSTHARK